MLDAGVITNRARNSNCAMHNVRVTAGCKTMSHTQSTVFYWLDEVNRSIVTPTISCRHLAIIFAVRNLVKRPLNNMCYLQVFFFFSWGRYDNFLLQDQCCLGVWQTPYDWKGLMTRSFQYWPVQLSFHGEQILINWKAYLYTVLYGELWTTAAKQSILEACDERFWKTTWVSLVPGKHEGFL